MLFGQNVAQFCYNLTTVNAFNHVYSAEPSEYQLSPSPFFVHPLCPTTRSHVSQSPPPSVYSCLFELLYIGSGVGRKKDRLFTRANASVCARPSVTVPVNMAVKRYKWAMGDATHRLRPCKVAPDGVPAHPDK